MHRKNQPRDHQSQLDTKHIKKKKHAKQTLSVSLSRRFHMIDDYRSISVASSSVYVRDSRTQEEKIFYRTNIRNYTSLEITHHAISKNQQIALVLWETLKINRKLCTFNNVISYIQLLSIAGNLLGKIKLMPGKRCREILYVRDKLIALVLDYAASTSALYIYQVLNVPRVVLIAEINFPVEISYMELLPDKTTMIAWNHQKQVILIDVLNCNYQLFNTNDYIDKASIDPVTGDVLLHLVGSDDIIKLQLKHISIFRHFVEEEIKNNICNRNISRDTAKIISEYVSLDIKNIPFYLAENRNLFMKKNNYPMTIDNESVMTPKQLKPR